MTFQPLTVVRLDQDDLRNEVEAPVAHKEPARERLDLHRAPVLRLVMELHPEVVPAVDALDGGHGLCLAFAEGADALAHDEATRDGLDLLRGLEAPARLLELGARQLLAQAVDARAPQPAAHEALDALRRNDAAPHRLVFKLPAQAALVAAPAALDLDSSPEFLLCADGVSPHPEPHDVSADIALHRDDGVLMDEELLPQLLEPAAEEVPQPELADDCRGLAHRLQAHLAHDLHPLRRLVAPNVGLDLGRSAATPEDILLLRILLRKHLTVLVPAEDTLDLARSVLLRILEVPVVALLLHHASRLPAARHPLEPHRCSEHAMLVKFGLLPRLRATQPLLDGNRRLLLLREHAPHEHSRSMTLDDQNGLAALLPEADHEASRMPLHGGGSLVQPRAPHAVLAEASLDSRGCRLLPRLDINVLTVFLVRGPPCSLDLLGSCSAQQLLLRRAQAAHLLAASGTGRLVAAASGIGARAGRACAGRGLRAFRERSASLAPSGARRKADPRLRLEERWRRTIPVLPHLFCLPLRLPANNDKRWRARGWAGWVHGGGKVPVELEGRRLRHRLHCLHGRSRERTRRMGLLHQRRRVAGSTHASLALHAHLLGCHHGRGRRLLELT
mmetsp:Transcript_68983/g.177797  ORF Transcript_68983/g.177797 Transcript_68983/m.177797 type:complete len:617 (+) Transcript_68983:305-2155(+)